MNNSSLKSNIMRVFSANFLVTLVGFVSSFVFPKILSIDAYAIYHTYTLYIGYIAILHLGFPSGMVINYAGANYRNIDKKQYKSEVDLLLCILGGFTVLFLAAALIKQSLMLFFVAISIIPVCWVGSYKALVQAWNDFKSYTRINLFVSLAVPIIALLYFFMIKDLPGNVYIAIYIVIFVFTTILLLTRTYGDVRGVQAAKLFSKKNYQTEKTGVMVAIGSYINTLFASADKQFVSWFFTNKEFAYYSFAMSMQAILSVLITSIAQPLFPAMAQGRFEDEDYSNVKSMLLILGSFGGCAYFATAVLVKLFITKYQNSLDITSLYFAVFPAMAVIQCLYINLYKIKGKIRSYMVTLGVVLGVAVVLNLFMVNVSGVYTGVAIATVLTYYIWLIIGAFQFKFIKFNTRDIVFLAIFFISYIYCTQMLNDIVGFFVYGIVITISALVLFRSMLSTYLKGFLHK